MVLEAINHVQNILETTLGEELLTLYRYSGADRPAGSAGHSDEGLLAVVADGTDLHRLREAFRPVQEAEGGAPRVPLIMRNRAFHRHLDYFPLFARQLADHGECLAGTEPERGEAEQADGCERAAYLAHQAMLASSVLVPELLAPGQAEADYASLQQVARRLTGKTFPENTPAAELFIQVQVALRKLLHALPGQAASPDDRAAVTRRGRNLQAIYNETDHTVCVLPELSTRRLRKIDWERLAERLQPYHTCLQVTTARQLRLIVQSEAALELALGRYEHEWGADPLDGVEVSTQAVWRNAGRLPSRLLVEDVPAAYLTAENDDAVHKVVHDYQNRLLNMGLQHELLHRFHGFEAAAPPNPLPGREEPVAARIDAILDQLDWWADYYYRQMLATGMGEKISAP